MLLYDTCSGTTQVSGLEYRHIRGLAVHLPAGAKVRMSEVRLCQCSCSSLTCHNAHTKTSSSSFGTRTDLPLFCYCVRPEPLIFKTSPIYHVHCFLQLMIVCELQSRCKAGVSATSLVVMAWLQIAVKDVMIRRGTLLLTPENTVVLGGQASTSCFSCRYAAACLCELDAQPAGR